MASVSSLGVGSGLDLGAILTQLIAAERAPATRRLDLREAETQASISAFGSLRSSLSDFQTTLENLSDLSGFQDRATVSSDRTLFTATAGRDSSVGTTNINVLSLAAAQRLSTAGFATPTTVIGTGSITIATGGRSFNINITDGSVDGIRQAINSSSAASNVTANLLTVDDGAGGTSSRLVISARETGLDNAISISVLDDDANNQDAAGLSQLFFSQGNANNRLTELDAAANGRITVDGFTVSSQNNQFEDAIQGVTITTLRTSDDPVNNPPASLTVSLNETAVRGNAVSFVTAFNGLKDTFNTLSNFNAGTGEAGLLNGDATLRIVETQIERLLFDSIGGGSGAFSNLSELGITTSENGRLSIDNERLSNVIANNFNDVGEFFAGNNGSAIELDAVVSRFLSGSGVIQSRQTGLANDLIEVADGRASLEARLAVIESRTRQQFTALDGLISRLNASGSFLTQQLRNTAAIITGIRDSN
jgi:flagellar hook-associated protein 2